MDNSQAVHLTIRKMTVDDLNVVLTWRNHPDIRRYMYTQHEISIEEHRAWFERASKDSHKHLLVFEIDEKPQGFVNITELSSSGVAEWGFYIAPDAVKGTGRQLGKAALEFAFNNLNLHKVCGQALAFNERSIQFHHSLGFQQEGTLRDQHYDGENYHAVICFGLLSNEWQPEDGNQ